MAKLEAMEGIGPQYAAQLRQAGVRSTGDLLKKGTNPEGRNELNARSGISPKLILEWINHADLFRIKGVGEEYADLLEESGVDTVVELARRKPEALIEAMKKVNEKKKLVRALPSQKKVTSWIAQVKKLPRVIKY